MGFTPGAVNNPTSLKLVFISDGGIPHSSALTTWFLENALILKLARMKQ